MPMRSPSAAPSCWPEYHHSQALKASASTTQPMLHQVASLNVTLCGPPWRISTRSTSKATTTTTAKAVHNKGEPIVSMRTPPYEPADASMQGTWKKSALRRSAKVSLTGGLPATVPGSLDP